MRIKNNRPCVIALPNDKVMMPGEEYDIPPDMEEKFATNPGFRIYWEAEYLGPAPSALPRSVPPPASVPPPPETARASVAPPPAGPADPRGERLALIATASAEALLALAEGETDPEFNAAIITRAESLQAGHS